MQASGEEFSQLVLFFAPSLPVLGMLGDSVFEFVDSGAVGVKVAWAPFDPVFMAFVGRVGDGFKEVTVSPGSAEIVRRTAVAAIKQNWENLFRVTFDDGGDLDRLFLAVAEVIRIGHIQNARPQGRSRLLRYQPFTCADSGLIRLGPAGPWCGTATE